MLFKTKNCVEKIKILFKNRNFIQKSKFYSKIEILVKNRHFVQKKHLFSSETEFLRQNVDFVIISTIVLR